MPGLAFFNTYTVRERGEEKKGESKICKKGKKGHSLPVGRKKANLILLLPSAGKKGEKRRKGKKWKETSGKRGGLSYIHYSAKANPPSA